MTLFLLVQPFRKQVFFILACIFLSNALALALPWGIKVIIDEVLVQKDLKLLNITILLLSGILLVRSRLSFLRKYKSSILGEKIICRLRERIYRHVLTAPLASVKEMAPSQMMTRMTGDLDSLRKFLFGDAIECIYAVFSVVFISLALLFLNFKLTLIALLTFPLFIKIYVRLLPQLKENHRHLRKMWGQMTARAIEALNGIATVRSFSGENHEKYLFWDWQKSILQTASRTHSLNTRLWVFVECFSSLGVMAILWMGARDVISHRMSAGDLVAFYSYLGMLFAPVVRLVVINGSYQEASASINRINEVLKTGAGIPRVRGAFMPFLLKGQVTFESVFFSYSPDEIILKGISFFVKSGETVGIVGASGAGKTTLINLLLGFYEPTGGDIRVDGRRLEEYDSTAYRRKLAVVFQDDFLFNGTIRENICYGSFHARKEDMIEASKAAHIYSFVLRLPEGFETQVGERGLNLSSGQRQRITIARALLKRPSILILDEATSAVDAITENQIQRSVAAFMRGKTVFIIAHRFSSIMEADKIIVIDKGVIVETGNHNYLLKRRGFYSSLYLEQFTSLDQKLLNASVRLPEEGNMV